MYKNWTENKWNSMRPTDAQLGCISIIEHNLPDVQFTGTTKYDAHRFIHRYIGRSKKVDKRRADNDRLYEDRETGDDE